ncbi:MAG: sigma-70 family RNA polymerase sigma factor [Anaerolineae bacterium]
MNASHPDPKGREAMTTSDALLLERWQEGDEAAFADIFARHYESLVRLLVKLLGSVDEAEDIAQETFWRLYRRPLSPEREHNLRGWLIRVGTRLAYNALRERARREKRQEVWKSQAKAADDPEAQALAEETRREVRQALARMPLHQAQILFLRHQGYTYAELAEIVGIKASSVGTLLARAERVFTKHYRGEPSDMTGS